MHKLCNLFPHKDDSLILIILSQGDEKSTGNSLPIYFSSFKRQKTTCKPSSGYSPENGSGHCISNRTEILSFHEKEGG